MFAPRRSTSDGSRNAGGASFTAKMCGTFFRDAFLPFAISVAISRISGSEG